MTEQTDRVTIRSLRPADIPQLITLEKAVYGSGAYTPYFFRQLYDLFPTLVWVAEDGGRIVGHVCGAIAQDNATGWLLNFAVQAHYRRRGIARQLVARCLEALEVAGARCVRVTSIPDNTSALQLVEAFGFVQTEAYDDYYGEGQPRVILERCNH